MMVANFLRGLVSKVGPTSAPEGATGNTRLSASLKRCPDTNPSFLIRNLSFLIRKPGFSVMYDLHSSSSGSAAPSFHLWGEDGIGSGNGAGIEYR